jgi:hypothetical protein
MPSSNRTGPGSGAPIMSRRCASSAERSSRRISCEQSADQRWVSGMVGEMTEAVSGVDSSSSLP